MTKRFAPRSPRNRETPNKASTRAPRPIRPRASTASQTFRKPLYIIFRRPSRHDPNRRWCLRATDHKPGPGDLFYAVILFNYESRGGIMVPNITVIFPDTGQIKIGTIESNMPKGSTFMITRDGTTKKIVRLPERTRSTARLRPKVNPGKKRVSFAVPSATYPRANSAPKLYLRGGCLSVFKRKKKIGDDETVPALLWYIAGGRPGARPTGKQMREWKQRSKGDWDEGRQRGFFKEIAYVLSHGKWCAHQRRKKVDQPAEGFTDGAPGESRDTLGDPPV